MSLLQLFALIAFMTPVANVPSGGSTSVLGQPTRQAVNSTALPDPKPVTRISIGIDPLEWINTNRY